MKLFRNIDELGKKSIEFLVGWYLSSTAAKKKTISEFKYSYGQEGDKSVVKQIEALDSYIEVNRASFLKAAKKFNFSLEKLNE